MVEYALQKRHMRPAVTIRTLFALFAALAVLIAPLSSPATAAVAASPEHHAQMAANGHCETTPADPGAPDEAPAKSCCVATCAAVAVAPSGSTGELEPRVAAAVFPIATRHLGYLGEIATPPPRRS